MRLLLLLAVLLLPVPAFAADWQVFSQTSYSGRQYYDTESIYRQSDGHVRVWTKYENQNPNLYELSCAGQGKNWTQKPDEWFFINPDMSFSSLQKIVCK